MANHQTRSRANWRSSGHLITHTCVSICLSHPILVINLCIENWKSIMIPWIVRIIHVEGIFFSFSQKNNTNLSRKVLVDWGKSHQKQMWEKKAEQKSSTVNGWTNERFWQNFLFFSFPFMISSMDSPRSALLLGCYMGFTYLYWKVNNFLEINKFIEEHFWSYVLKVIHSVFVLENSRRLVNRTDKKQYN